MFCYLALSPSFYAVPTSPTSVIPKMDIPLPDELEWLEANSHLHDDYPDFDDPSQPYPQDEHEHEFQPQSNHQNHQQPQPPKPTLSIPPKTAPTAKTQIKKRFRSDGQDSSVTEEGARSEDKRKKGDDVRLENEEGEGEGEDWLRYSPPPTEEGGGMVEEDVVVEEERVVSRFASEIDGDFVPVTGLDGERVYAKMSSRVEEMNGLKKVGIKVHTGGLISEPINILIQRAETQAFTKALQSSVEGSSDAILPETPVVNEKLWVDKYAPNSFMELLSDEQTNREVLLWLKQWDSCVFGSGIRTTTDEVLSSLRRHSTIAQHQKLAGRSFSRNNRDHTLSKGNFEVNNGLGLESNDAKGIPESWDKKTKGSGPAGPPERKVRYGNRFDIYIFHFISIVPCFSFEMSLESPAVLQFPSAGIYINASDDRSSSTIEGKILDVVQMNSVMADLKPKCLVIDEIDGALGDGKGAVEVILKMLSAERKSEVGKEDESKEGQIGKTSSRKKHRSASLSRPVICICNDLYAPALRPLRQVAKVHIFVQPSVSRVVSRLKYICNKEGLKTSSIALTALAEYTDCDIRSCLNTLQFLHKKKEPLNVLEIDSQVVGRKDTSRSVFEIWKEIFQKRKEKRERKVGNGCSSMSKDFEFVHSLISSRGDYDLIFDGIHENILQLHYHDPVMRKTVAVHLLSDKEKKDMVQLVNTMVSYSMTYKNQKADPVPSILRHEAVVEASMLSFDPPIGDLINFKGYSSSHFVLAAAMKQVLVHEVEKQKILQGSVSKSMDPTDVCSKGNLTPVGEQKGRAQSSAFGCATTSCAENMQNAKNTSNLRQSKLVTNQVSAASGSTLSATASVQVSSPGPLKKPSSGSFNFFDRFRKLSSKGSENADNPKNKPATSERDSRPLLFKYNEVTTNHVV
ncbi:hypothetical protein RHGRI_025995 [Rhododendron griersonianum]|uniref:Chromosome transmission fidelity protein 18 homolog n=1 Tax=Rhododendron griersonianum TaxID=479676 RepID=A0AAV6IVL9_9ERIC|nr:hypothetical protein RHGRI_025995 [Rhododendron griersonianum]